MADIGASMHNDAKETRRKANIRSKITRTVQNMMVAILIEHRKFDEDDRVDDYEDVQIMSEQYQSATAGWMDYDDYDYGP